MSFTISNNRNLANGTSYCGLISATYDLLCSKLGKPSDVNSGDNKVRKEWIICFDCGTIAVVYDWKSREDVTELTTWHIGGKGINIVQKVGLIFNNKK